MKIILTYDSDAPLDKRCTMTLSDGEFVVSNFDFKWDYLSPKNLQIVEEVHIGAWGKIADRRMRAQKVAEAIKGAASGKTVDPS